MDHASKPNNELTSIADIILYPHESMVSFHSGKPSGMTGSELSSCKGRKEKIMKIVNIYILTFLREDRIAERRMKIPESGSSKGEGPLSTCIATWDQGPWELMVGVLEALPLTSLAFLHQPSFLALPLPLVLLQPVISICIKKLNQVLMQV